MAVAHVRPRLRAALPAAQQRLGPPGHRRADRRVRDRQRGQPRRVRARTCTRSSTGCPATCARSSPRSTRSPRCGRSASSSSPRSSPAGGDSRATSPSPASSRGCSAGSSARSSSRTRASRKPRRRHPIRRRHRPSFPVVRLAVDRRGDLGGVAVPHAAGPAARAAPRAADRGRRRCTSAPATRTACSRRWRSAGRSPRSCTSRSDRRVGARPPRRSRRRSAELGRRRPTTSSSLPDAAAERGTAMVARATTTGALHVRVLGRDEADAQLLSKSWRFASLQGRRARRCTLTRLEDVEHQAYALLLAERAGVRVPPGRRRRHRGSGRGAARRRDRSRARRSPTSIPQAVTDERLDRPVGAGRRAARGARRARAAERDATSWSTATGVGDRRLRAGHRRRRHRTPRAPTSPSSS